jgi:glutathione peroxidase
MANVYDIPVKDIDGKPATLADYKGKVLLVVNVASACGLTPQYEGLEKLYESYRTKGVEVLGFPANNFGAQEPGTDEEIKDFCTSKFDVKFPMFSKISVRGDDQHPLYRELVSQKPNATEQPGGQLFATLEKHGLAPKSKTEVAWNFEKFVVGKDGKVVGRFHPDVPPDSPLLKAAIDSALAS